MTSGRTLLAAWMHHAFLSVWLTLSCDSPHREEQFYQTDNMKENSVFPHLLLTWTERLSLFLRCFYLLQWRKKGEKSEAVPSKTNINRLKGLPHMDRCTRGKDTHTHTRLFRFQLLLWIQIVCQIAVKMARRTRRKNSQTSSERRESERERTLSGARCAPFSRLDPHSRTQPRHDLIALDIRWDQLDSCQAGEKELRGPCINTCWHTFMHKPLTGKTRRHRRKKKKHEKSRL